MNKILNKKVGIAAAIVAVIAIVAIIFSTTFSSAMTLDEAKEIAKKYVPSTAEFVTSQDEGNKFEVMFHDDRIKESYEVEVSKDRKEVKKVETQLDDDSGSKEVKLKEQDIEKIIREKFSGVSGVSVNLTKDNGLYEYETTFKSNEFYGDADVHPVSGVILDSTVKYGTAVTIPAEGNNNNNSGGNGSADGKILTAKEVEDAVIKAAGGGFVKDMELEDEKGRYFYEVELAKDGREYDYYVDASTGEVTLENEHDSYFDHDDEFDLDEMDDHIRDTAGGKGSGKAVISEDKAKSIVLAKIPGANFVYLNLENDDGIRIYEGKATLGQHEYEFEINAESGVIIEWDKDMIEKDDHDEWDD